MSYVEVVLALSGRMKALQCSRSPSNNPFDPSLPELPRLADLDHDPGPANAIHLACKISVPDHLALVARQAEKRSDRSLVIKAGPDDIGERACHLDLSHHFARSGVNDPARHDIPTGQDRQAPSPPPATLSTMRRGGA